MTEHRIELRAREHQRISYSGRTALITDINGYIRSGSEGLYVDNTRLLSRHDLTLNHQRPELFISSPVDGHGFLAYARVPDAEGLPSKAIFLELARFVGGGLRERIRLHNFSPHEQAKVVVRLYLDADFADFLEVRQGRREQLAGVVRRWHPWDSELIFEYQHPELSRALAIRLDSPGPVRYEHGALSTALEIAPHAQATLELAYEPVFDGRRRTAPSASFDEPADALGSLRERLRREAPRLVATNPSVAEAWGTAVRDLSSLPLGLPPGPAAPIAGLPSYHQFFGRDTLIAGLQSLILMPRMLADAMRVHAALQGTREDPEHEEQPGRLVHQASGGPLSVLGFNPFERFYGDHTAGAAFLMALGHYLAWTNDLETVRALLPTARKVIDWEHRYGDLDGDGFLEYQPQTRWLKNLGWKDSPDAIVDENGETVEPPIGTCEMQGYYYAGLRMAALAFLRAGDRTLARALLREARELKERFNRVFWIEDLGFYALAIGPDKRPLRTIASNAGHLLATGIVPPERAARLARRLFEPDLFSGWGIRTLSSQNPAFNPFSYHRGSVWPAETGPIAAGLARYGRIRELHLLAEATFAAADLFVAHRLPEVLGGMPRDAEHPHPGIYRRSNSPQAWSASVPALVVQALLGLRPVAPLATLLIDPHLPHWLPWLRLEGLRLGQASIDLEVWRARSGGMRWAVARREGHLRVLRQPLAASVTRRAAAAVESLPLVRSRGEAELTE